MICANCGAKLKDNERFCNKCGAKIHICPKCGFNNHQEAKFCRNCGWELSKDVTKENKLEQTTQQTAPGRTLRKAKGKKQDAKKQGRGTRIAIVILIILLIVALLGTIGYLLYTEYFKAGNLPAAVISQKEEKEEPSDTESADQTDTESADQTDTESADQTDTESADQTDTESADQTSNNTENQMPEDNKSPTDVKETQEVDTSASESVQESVTEIMKEAPTEDTPITRALLHVDQPGSWDGHAYAIFDIYELELDTYLECEAYCESIGGHLAVIDSQEENDFIYQFIQDNGRTTAFFGYSDREKEGDWKWVTGDSHFVNWAPGQPNNGAVNPGGEKEHYAHFFTDEERAGMWNDAPFGSNTHYIVCEWE